MAAKKAAAILSAAKESLSFGHGNSGITFLIGHYGEMIRILDEKTAALLKQIKRSVQEQPDFLLARQTRLLESIPETPQALICTSRSVMPAAAFISWLCSL